MSALSLAMFHCVRRGNSGSPSRAAIHSSGSGASVSRRRSLRQCLSSVRATAAGPPRSALIHLRVPTRTLSTASSGSS
eukprot:3233441-Lingulodinium_polyedra.AAC.1